MSEVFGDLDQAYTGASDEALGHLGELAVACGDCDFSELHVH